MNEETESWKNKLETRFSAGVADGEVATELLLFQLGGVQDFIAQARSAHDLWSGSYLTAWLMAHALKAVTDDIGPNAVVFPSLKESSVFGALQSDAPRGDPLNPALPNRFLAVVPAGQGQAFAEKAENALRTELTRIGDSVFQEAWNRTLWDDQLNNFPYITWAVHPWQKGENWTSAYAALEDKLAARRNTHNFAASKEKANERKDSLSGKEEAIALDGNKPYGAMNLIKRKWAKVYLEKRVGTKNIRFDVSDAPSIAILAMDGDEMGKLLSGEKLANEQKRIPAYHLGVSQALIRFAEQRVRKVVEDDCSGTLVYAGGDDVLAVLPANQAIDCARALRNAFRQAFGSSISCDLSCGIAVGSKKAPLQMIVKEAHRMVEAAKSEYGRAALAIALYKRSGEIVEWGCKWGSAAWELMGNITELSRGRNSKLSGRLPHTLLQHLQPYGLEAPIFSKEIILTEFAHVLSRLNVDSGGNSRYELLKQANEYLDLLSKEKVKNRICDFLNLFLVENFINRKRGEH